MNLTLEEYKVEFIFYLIHLAMKRYLMATRNQEQRASMNFIGGRIRI